MSQNLNIRPVYFTKESWNMPENNYSCNLHKYLNNPVFFIPTKKEPKKNETTKLKQCSICWE